MSDEPTPLELDLRAELDLALELVERCDAFTLPRFTSRSLRVDRKADRTEVTEADRGAETLVAQGLAAARPHHGVVGEEHGLQGDVGSPWRWIVDPIDGTSGFVRGIPVWATLLALTREVDGRPEPVLGVVSAPALGRRWWAARGLGTSVDGQACRVSDVAELGAAQLSVTFSDGWDRLGLTDELVALQREVHRSRGFGDFWQHCLVAEGAIDAAIDAVGVAPYDLAAVSVVVEEAGGRFTDRHGARRLDAGTAISSNRLLHDRLIARLSR